MKILWLTNIPSPYRIEFFNELGNNLELTVLFERNSSSERDSSWENNEFENFNGIVLKGKNIGVDKAISFNVLSYIKKNRYDHIVVSNPLTPTGIIAISYMKLMKVKYIIETDGGFPKTVKGLKELFKKIVYRNANLYMSTGQIHDQYYMLYGAEKNKIFHYPFTSIRDKDIIVSPVSIEEKYKYRKALGLQGEQIILSVGRFVYEKGFDVLIEAAKNLPDNYIVYIVGGTPTFEYLELIKKHKITNIYFREFVDPSILNKYYRASDLFVLPTRGDVWGLVINEAMARGLPIITTDKCIAGTELVEDGENGYLVNVNDVSALQDAITKVTQNSELKMNMSKNSLNRIKKYTIETMVKKHIEVFRK